MKKINFFFSSRKPIQIERKKIRKIVQNVFNEEGFDYENVNIIFCNDAYLLEMNKKFLNHNFLTDIITFDNSVGRNISGELYISLERVEENAIKFKVPVKVEVWRVIIHGILHLVNYRDKLKQEKIIMRKKEDYYLSKFDEENE